MIASNGSDTDLVALRAAIVAGGGTVFYRYLSINGLLAMVPLAQIDALSLRSDVASISADRVTTRTFSAVETMSAVSSQVRIGNNFGYTGSGVGIAFLDSGVMRKHQRTRST